MATDPEILAHKHWIGYVQPVGLVVSIPALLNAQCYINQNVIPDHQRFLANIDQKASPATIKDFPTFVGDVFEWDAADLLADVPSSLEVPLPEYGEVLKPTYAVKEFKPAEGKSPWLLLVKELPTGQSFDDVATADDRRWQASPHAQFERLLRETQVPIGLLVNGTHIRLVYAPRGENSGYATFRVADMVQVSGRPIFGALHMLLSAERLFTLPEKQRLPAILEASRKYQSLVSTQLAEQMLAALYEMLRGFQAADEARNGALLADVLKAEPNHVYSGLLTVLMRLVFVLYAEDRNLLSSDPLYSNFYSVTGLFERLRADAGRYPDTMDQRYGAWSQLLTLFRLIHDGAPGLNLPARHGYLFDPDRYNFLEGRPWQQRRREREKLLVPRLSDGVIFRVLTNLLVLDGERLSYRTLDVEQIGSVYEVMMGFGIGVAAGPTIAIKPKKRLGAPVPINLEELLGVSGAERAKWLKTTTDQEVTGDAVAKLKDAGSVEALLAALERRIAREVTPNVIAKGAMVPVPSDERRRSGSNYTPRSLTEPIVRKTLEPILKRLGEHPTPDQLLELKVCDPAMGSGAFLVEACRQLGDQIVKAWHHHKCLPKLPPDEDELLYARRIIAQRCLYGVDKNPMAADLAKLSMWLATLAREHAFTFLDHAFRAGDSLVGLTRRQIEEFTWEQPTGAQKNLFFAKALSDRIGAALAARREILDCGDEHYCLSLKRQKLTVADDRLDLVRFIGDLAVAAFFAADKGKVRKAKREDYLGRLTAYLQSGDVRQRPTDAVTTLKAGDKGVTPFHWEIEFPEVFGRQNPGFDAIVGNPPFAGVLLLHASVHPSYTQFLRGGFEGSGGKCDLVAFFFRLAFSKLRDVGCLGLVATNTIAQGDTRESSLTWICLHGGVIYAAQKRLVWPGAAAVIVSVVHVVRGERSIDCELNGRKVERITAFLFHDGGHESPRRLATNDNRSFKGADIYSPGFTFDVTDNDGTTGTIEEMNEIIRIDRRAGTRILPYLGGEEILNSPGISHRRYVIDLDGLSEEDARSIESLWRVVECRVKPERMKLGTQQAAESLKTFWWHYGYSATGMREMARSRTRFLAHPYYTGHLAFAFVDAKALLANPNSAFAYSEYSPFAVLQSRTHEVWVRFVASSFKDDLRYTPTDCFETFPLPERFETNTSLEAAGKVYYDFRAALMVKNNEGLTKTYNRFHDPDETSRDILKLRDLHVAMDRAVLDAYGWSNIPTDCQFLLDYEEDEDDDADITSSPRKGKGKKKPWRYRWPDEVRDEVLARLLALNAERAKAERLVAEAGAAKTKKAKKPKGQSTSTEQQSGPDLFTARRK
jgi:hypothetical protein